MRSERPPTCAKCGGRMTEGFILDNTDHARLQSEWIEGPPEKIRWLGGLKVKGRARLPVVTFRCSKCGYLESFAPSGEHER